MGDGTRFWVGASTVGALGSAAGGIRPLDIAPDGAFELGDPVDVGENPMYLAVSPAGVLGVVHELAEGRLSTWSIDGDALTPAAPAGATGAGDPCHLAFDATGDWAFAANYSGAQVSAHRMRTDAATDVVLSAAFTGSGPDASRQESPHPHQVVLDRARSRLLVPDLGSDRIRVIGLDALPDALGRAAGDAGDLVVHAGAGPRHLVIAGDLAVVANELDRTASVFDLVDGSEVASFPVDERVASRGMGLSAIRLTAAGTVLVGDRDADALVALRLDVASRTLERVASLPTGGRHPRDLHVTHDERHALVADQASDSIAVISLDAGVPTAVVATISTPAPACLARMP
ncbi:6-phosphogluconolactonase [Agromyces terreus]|uniref:6-phosphogluconolactonase n=1 Tax=Agromyces terreus TaxID=424795 RepID=A0A9X2KG85_9MICO|nr:beta-propeller fold lactonase family protein [Agromyces terreus]MCP2372582.1 6-phosphogluconolactonase [Agromyces terreus]